MLGFEELEAAGFFFLRSGVLGSTDFIGLGGGALESLLLRFYSMASSSFALSVTLLDTCRTDGGLFAALEGVVEFFGDGFFWVEVGAAFAGAVYAFGEDCFMKFLISLAGTILDFSSGITGVAGLEENWNFGKSTSKSLFGACTPRTGIEASDSVSLGESVFYLLNLAGVYLKSFEDLSKGADAVGPADIEPNKRECFVSD